MKKGPRGSHDVVVDAKLNVTLAQWKDNKVVTVASALYGQQPIRKAKRYIKDKGGRVDIDQPNSIAEYNKTMVGVDRMDQNISYYMISIRNKKWWWPLFYFCIDLAVSNAYQLYQTQPLQPGQKILDLLGFIREVVNAYYAKNDFLR